MSKKSIIINAAIALSVVLAVGAAYKGYQSHKHKEQIVAEEQKVNDMLAWGKK
jgi:hypothetical protein